MKISQVALALTALVAAPMGGAFAPSPMNTKVAVSMVHVQVDAMSVTSSCNILTLCLFLSFYRKIEHFSYQICLTCLP